MHEIEFTNAPIPGKVLFACYIESKDGVNTNNHVYYDQEADSYNGMSLLSGALYKTMKAYPALIEPILLVAQVAAEELSDEFIKQLKEK